MDKTKSLVLTFDVEDFTKNVSLRALTILLKLLKRYNLKSLFFVTGYMAETLKEYPDILQLLENHEIGYHSSSHSVRPIIPEFTDTRRYSKAVEISLIRETSHINPLTGEPEEEGGIKILREIFNNKEVVSFRAPGFCWTPPHLEALQKLGIKYDFSAKLHGIGLLSGEKIAFKGTIFYPFPTYVDFWENPLRLISLFSSNLSKRKIVCLSSHEWLLASPKPWDSVYWRNNPKDLTSNSEDHNLRIVSNFLRFDTFLKGIKVLEKFKILKVTPFFEGQEIKLDASCVDVAKTFHSSMRWAEHFFNYNPRYVLSHFYRYFDRHNVDS